MLACEEKKGKQISFCSSNIEKKNSRVARYQDSRSHADLKVGFTFSEYGQSKFPDTPKSYGNHSPIFLVLICLLNSKFGEIKGIYLAVSLFRIKREASVVAVINKLPMQRR